MSSLSFAFPQGGLPTMTCSFMFADWDEADGTKTTMTLTGAVLGQSTYTNHVLVPVMDSEFHLRTVGTATKAIIHPASFTIEPNISYAPVVSAVGGTNGILGWVRTATPPVVSGTLTLHYEDTTFLDYQDARTNIALFVQIGTTVATGAICFSMPTVQLRDFARVRCVRRAR